MCSKVLGDDEGRGARLGRVKKSKQQVNRAFEAAATSRHDPPLPKTSSRKAGGALGEKVEHR